MTQIVTLAFSMLNPSLTPFPLGILAWGLDSWLNRWVQQFYPGQYKQELAGRKQVLDITLFLAAAVATFAVAVIVVVWLRNRSASVPEEKPQESPTDTFSAWINPLSFIELDIATDPAAVVPSPEEVLGFLCEPGTSVAPGALADRYRQITSMETRLFAPPSEARILEKLIWPLRHAKASYMLGNHLATISLCGMVAEMVAVFAFELAEVRLNQNQMSEAEQRALFGRTFEALGQARRIQILRAYGLIDDKVKAHFDLIRTTRRGYLHLWSHEHAGGERDAKRVYKAATALVAVVIGKDIKDGLLVLNPALIRYILQKQTADAKVSDVNDSNTG